MRASNTPTPAEQAGSAVVDHLGRRKLLLAGIACAGSGMCIVGFLLSPLGEESKMRADAGITFICTCSRQPHLTFSLVYDDVLFRMDSFAVSEPDLNWFRSMLILFRGLYPAEVLTFENRAKGLSLQSWVTSLCSLINTFGLPPALGKLGYISEPHGYHSCHETDT
jgi:hypothetical protein